MAEYIDRDKVLMYEERVITNHYDGNETLYVVSTEEIRGLTPADVVERSEYNELARVNKALQERVTFLESNRPCRDCGSNPISEYADLENENKYFREKMAKIDTAIEEMERNIKCNTDPETGLVNLLGQGQMMMLYILKKNLGDTVK